MTRAACGVALAVLSLAAAPAPLIDIRNAGDPARRIEARATLDTFEILLSGEVKLTLTVEGPGPLSVTPSKPLLTKPNLWRVREDAPPIRELNGSREKWTQVYRLSPLVRGKTELPVGPLVVRAGGDADVTVNWNEGVLVVDVGVRKSVQPYVETPTPDALRKAADIEQLPPAAPIESRNSPWLFAVVPALLLLAGLGVLLGRRKRSVLLPRDGHWALGELADPDLTADRCAMILRQYVAFRYGVPGEAKTTPELAAALRSDGRMPNDAVLEWQGLLDECDAARFSGTAATVAGLVDRARQLVLAAEDSLNPTK